MSDQVLVYSCCFFLPALLIIVGIPLYLRKRAADRAKKLEEALRREQQRRADILRNVESWGLEFCQLVIEHKVAIGMNQDMVLASWGKPDTIDQVEIAVKSKSERWIYGQRRRDAQYIWFKNSKVVKVKTT